MQPFVSIILPTYNGARYIASAIASVQAQSYTNWELIIIDDGSTDDTEAIVQSFSHADSRIQYVKNDQNLGIQKTLNRGLALAKGEYIARIDDDDQWIDTDKLRAQVSFLESHPDYVLVGTGVILISECNIEITRYLLPEKDKNIRGRILSQNCFAHSAVMFRRQEVLAIGGYSEENEKRHVEDYDLWLRLGKINKLYNLPIYGAALAVRGTSLSGLNKMNQFKKNIFLINLYKNSYSGYYFALIRSYVRILFYGIVIKTPLRSIVEPLRGLYKKVW